MTFTNTKLRARWVRVNGELVCVWQPLPAVPLTRAPRPARLTV